MRMSGRLAAMLLIGLGLGTVAGAYLHNAAVWSGLALVVIGIGVAVVGRLRTAGDTPGDAAGDAPGDGVGDATGIPAQPGPEPAADRPRLSGLGTRVEQILRLAEQQANVHNAESEREAEQIVANARAEAQAIIDKARKQAS